MLVLGPYESGSNDVVANYLAKRRRIEAMLKESIQKGQGRMKWYANKKRSERTLEVRDFVYLNLHFFRQTTVAIRKNLKLASNYYGPYEVEKKIREVAYKLKLLAGTLIHHVFHVILLQKRIGKGRVACQDPLLGSDGQPRVEPIAILERRLVKKNRVCGSMVSSMA